MIDKVLGIVRQELNDHLTRAGGGMIGGQEDLVVFPNGDKPDPGFKIGKVTLLLAGVNEERVMRDPDRYRTPAADGTSLIVHPALRLSLMMLIAARHASYADSLHFLSLAIGWCQARPVIDGTNTPQLDPAIERVTLEHVALTFSEQNELWSGLGTGYLPSALYRVRLLSFMDVATAGAGAPPITRQPERELLHAGS